MDLSTNYMGLALRNPLVASASPLSYTVDGIRRLADAGVGAVVLFSLFEEQLREEAALNARLVDGPAESFPEALDYLPAIVREDTGPRHYLSLLERGAAAVEVPVIASLNGVSAEGWTDYARATQEAGAAAIELNIYHLPGDAHTSGRDVEQRHIDILERSRTRSPCRSRSNSAHTSVQRARSRCDSTRRAPTPRAVQPLPATGHRSRRAHPLFHRRPLGGDRRAPATDLDRTAARKGPCRACGDRRRRRPPPTSPSTCSPVRTS